MARLGRYFLPDQPLHVIQRGNNRQAIFFDGFVEALRRATNGGWALSDARFKQAIAEALGRRVAPLPLGRKAKPRDDDRQISLL
jgi:hypothetical protein